MKLAHPDETWKRFLVWALFAAEAHIWFVAISFAAITLMQADDDWQIGLVLAPVALGAALAVRWVRRRWLRFGFRSG